MDFDKKKTETLSWQDNSKKGSIDIQIKPLLDAINKRDNFYTTSSCAGRIDLIHFEDTKRKDYAEWLYVTHDEAEYEKILNSLSQIPKGEVWFKMESAIIHVCTKTIEDATWLLNKTKEVGFKHSGILSNGKRIIVEIFGSEKLEAIIVKDGKLLVDNNYLKILTDISNEKLLKTRSRIENLRKIIY